MGDDRPVGLLSAALAFIDKPWKALALAGLAVVGLILYIAYERRDDIADAILHHKLAPRLVTKNYKAEAANLLAVTGANASALFTLDLDANSIAFVAGYDRAGAPWAIYPLPQVALTDDSIMPLVIRLLEGETVCYDPKTTDPQIHRKTEAREGIVHSCLIGIPPVLGVRVGLLYLGWRAIPSRSEEITATQQMRIYARRLAVW
jgi:hypothetical protein